MCGVKGVMLKDDLGGQLLLVDFDLMDLVGRGSQENLIFPELSHFKLPMGYFYKKNGRDPCPHLNEWALL